jgi:hypothetical protein
VECQIERGVEEGRELSRAWEGGPMMGVEGGDSEGMRGHKDRVSIRSDSTIPKSQYIFFSGPDPVI